MVLKALGQQSPVDYREVGRVFDATRSVNTLVAALLIAFAAIAVDTRLFIVAVAVLIWTLADFLYRRRYPAKSALVPLLTDITVIFAAGLLFGVWPTLVVGAMAYVITASVLLLPKRAALLLTAYQGAALLISATFSLGLLSEVRSSTTFNYLVGGIFLTVMAGTLIATGRALTATRLREQQVLVAERRANEMKTEFVSMVSHELRTPLTSIAGFADTLRGSWRALDASEVDEFLGIISEQAGHLGNMVEDILILPRLEAGNLRLNESDVDVGTVVVRQLTILFPEGGRKQASTLIPPDLAVRADRNRLQQVLRNLLENARKYGGDEIRVEAHADETDCTISVTDNGPGIPPAAQDLIFEHFEQVSKGDARSGSGVGLGLPIARMLVRAMGGELWFEPAFPRGAVFKFTLPLAAEQEQRRSA